MVFITLTILDETIKGAGATEAGGQTKEGPLSK